MKFDIITIFPELFNDFTSQTLVARAIKKKLISIQTHQLRDWTTDNHKTVDGRPYGGGAGMVLMVEPIAKAVKAVARKSGKTRIVLMSAKGKPFTQKEAHRLAKYDRVVFICGRYEGVDERVATDIADEELSVGPYVLFGGEIPAMVVMEAVSRLIPGVIKMESLQEESFWNSTLKEEVTGAKGLEYPHYTRPEVFTLGKKKLRVPPVLLTGNHGKIKAWRDKHRK